MGNLVRGVIAGGVLAAAGLGVAGPAAAEALDGAYRLTVTDGGGFVDNGAKDTAFMTPCGTDCTKVATPIWSAEMRLQGATWTGVTSSGLVFSFDKDSLAGSLVKNGNETVLVQLDRAF